MTQPIKELLEAADNHHQELRKKQQEAQAFCHDLYNLCYNYNWEPSSVDQLQVGQWGIVRSQGWLFQVTAIYENWFAVEVHEGIEALYHSTDNTIWNDPNDCIGIYFEYPENYHYEDEGVWLLKDCLFAVYKGGN
jgi:hypothetical protein